MAKLPKSLHVKNLRKNKKFMAKLGAREKAVLMKPGARVKYMPSYAKGYYQICNENEGKCFDFLYNSPHGENYKIVG